MNKKPSRANTRHHVRPSKQGFKSRSQKGAPPNTQISTQTDYRTTLRQESEQFYAVQLQSCNRKYIVVEKEVYGVPLGLGLPLGSEKGFHRMVLRIQRSK